MYENKKTKERERERVCVCYYGCEDIGIGQEV